MCLILGRSNVLVFTLPNGEWFVSLSPMIISKFSKSRFIVSRDLHQACSITVDVDEVHIHTYHKIQPAAIYILLLNVASFPTINIICRYYRHCRSHCSLHPIESKLPYAQKTLQNSLLGLIHMPNDLSTYNVIPFMIKIKSWTDCRWSVLS